MRRLHSKLKQNENPPVCRRNGNYWSRWRRIWRSDSGAYRWPPFAAELQPSLVDDRLFRRMGPRIADLQVVVLREINAKIPGHHVVLAQGMVHDDALHIADQRWHAPGRIGNVATRARTARAKLAHDTGQTLGPVTGPKGLSQLGHTQDVEFFCGRIHIDCFSATPVPKVSRGVALHKNSTPSPVLKLTPSTGPKGTGTVPASVIKAP